MRVEVLLSCMHQVDFSIISNSNIKSDVLIINQSDNEDYLEYIDDNGFKVRMITTKERGLSKSRNMAIRYAQGDICLICDDDEVLHECYEEIITSEFIKNKNADIIIFALNYPPKKFPIKKQRIKYLKSLKINSCQIAFLRKSIIASEIKFNEDFGSGSNNGPGEENIFLFDCLRKRLKIFYVPEIIATINTGDSYWFHGYNEKYFIDRGKITNVLLGKFLSSLYAVQFVIKKYSRYRKDISFFKALKLILKGIFK